ncbi:MAG: hypothetical protein J6S89_08125 [Paludibacteraceae bacterium]|nr:hypothetical protein [Paludibacteraceae bacterium]
MTTLYFNEILPSCSERNIQALFECMVKNTARLINKLRLSKPIVTGSPACELKVCGIALNDLIAKCNNRNVRTEAQYLFGHNLIVSHENSLTDDDNQQLLEADYTFQGKNAINMAIAHKMEWPLLSIPIDATLEHNYLTLESLNGTNLDVANYFAQDDTTFIEKWITDKTNAGLEGLERFKVLFGLERTILTGDFVKGWNSATTMLQGLAYERFKYAIDKGMIFPIKTDDRLIKKTDVDGGTDVYELRQKGQGLRIYFGYSDDGKTIVMAGFHTKAESEGEEQSADINRAAGQIRKLLAVSVDKKDVKNG